MSECDFDFPDCVNKTSSPSPSWASQDWNVGGQKNSQYCSSGNPKLLFKNIFFSFFLKKEKQKAVLILGLEINIVIVLVEI